MQKEIISVLQTKATINPEIEIKERVRFLKSYLTKSGLNGFVIAISGGQDSTLTGILCKKAIEEINKQEKESGKNIPKKSLYAIRLPYGVQKDEKDAEQALKLIQADVELNLNIKSNVDEIVKNIENNSKIQITDFEKGNVKARQRMVIQYAIAGAKKLLVVGTDHAAEAITGFYTKFGDGGADLMPLYGLNKRQGKQLLKKLNIPENLIYKTPTADLEDNKPLLSDEIALGVTYNQIDDYLEGKEISDTARKIIEQKYISSNHKRNLPVTPYSVKL